MLNTYVTNKGITQTIIYNNNRSHFNQSNWDTEYDGNFANISLYSNTDGKTERINVTLDNDDLANIFTYPSINIPIDKRLKYDYSQPQLITNERNNYDTPKSIDKIIKSYISSPRNNEEFIVPVTINKMKSKPRKNKTHTTYKVYKKHKTNTNSKGSRKLSSSRRRQSRENKKTTTRYSII